MSGDDPSGPTIGLHSSQIMFQRYRRDHERLLASYNEWVRKREKRLNTLNSQIDSIKQSSDPESKQAKKLLSKLESDLATFQEEESEVPDPEILKNYPHSHRCHRPAYRKLAFQLALEEFETRKKLAEDVYNKALSLRNGGEVKSSSEEPIDSSEGAAENSTPPTSSSTANSIATAEGKKMSAIKRFDSFLTRLESGKSMTKTFSPRPESGSERTYSRWALRASPFQPHRGNDPPASS